MPTIGRALNVPDTVSRSRLWPANALRRLQSVTERGLSRPTSTLPGMIAMAPWPQPPKEIARLRRAAKPARTTQIDNHRIRAFRRSKRSAHKCSRTEIEKSAYTEEKAGDETEIDQSFA